MESQRLNDLAWAAGLFDGDGGFYLETSDGRPRRLVAAITQTAEELGSPPAVLERFLGIVGVGAVHGPDPANRAFVWRTTATSATCDVFRLLGSCLFCVKRQQLADAITRRITLRQVVGRPIGPRSLMYRGVNSLIEKVAAEIGDSDDCFQMSVGPAWAAGLFDAEGSTYVAVDRSSGRLKLRMKVSQSSTDGTVPEVLLRSGQIVKTGRLDGPRTDRGRLPHFLWLTSAYESAVIMHERPCDWLGPVKREQAHRALITYGAYVRTGRKRDIANRDLRCLSGSATESPARTL